MKKAIWDGVWRGCVFANSGSEHKLLACVVSKERMELQAATLPRCSFPIEPL